MHQVAENVRPFPVIGFNPETNTIIAVNDRYFLSHDGATIQNASGSSSNSRTSGGSSTTRQTTSGSESPQNTRNDYSSATSSGSASSDKGSGNDHPPPPPPSSPPPPSPTGVADPKSSVTTAYIGPFLGTFTIQDQFGHEQCAKITFCLRIESKAIDRRVLTTTALANFCLSLPSPGELHERSSRDPLSPYFVCNELQLVIDPDSPYINGFEPCSRSPKGRWDVKKVSKSSGLTGGVTLSLAFLPGVQFPVSKKSGLSVDLDPISQHIDFKRAASYEIRKTREHLWKYPLRKERPKDNDLELPTHSSEIRYRTSVNVESIHARVIAIHVVDSKSRTANKLKRKALEERQRRRAQSQPFKFEGDSKHLILQFAVTVKKRNGEPFLQFEGPGIERSLYHKVGRDSSRPRQAAAWQAPSERPNSSESDGGSQADGSLSLKWSK